MTSRRGRGRRGREGTHPRGSRPCFGEVGTLFRARTHEQIGSQLRYTSRTSVSLFPETGRGSGSRTHPGGAILDILDIPSVWKWALFLSATAIARCCRSKTPRMDGERKVQRRGKGEARPTREERREQRLTCRSQSSFLKSSESVMIHSPSRMMRGRLSSSPCLWIESVRMKPKSFPSAQEGRAELGQQWV